MSVFVCVCECEGGEVCVCTHGVVGRVDMVLPARVPSAPVSVDVEPVTLGWAEVNELLRCRGMWGMRLVCVGWALMMC